MAEIIATAQGSSPSQRTLQRLFVRLGLHTLRDGSPPVAFGRFGADDVKTSGRATPCIGPAVAGRKTIRQHPKQYSLHQYQGSADSLNGR